MALSLTLAGFEILWRLELLAVEGSAISLETMTSDLYLGMHGGAKAGDYLLLF